MREVFEDLKGYENNYQISDQGRVFTKRRLVGNRILYGRELIPFLTQDGYLRVKLCKDGKEKDITIHRLVAMQFVDNPNNLPQVNHKDGNKLNNCVSNLEWCTKEANGLHAKLNGLMQHGADRPSSKLTESDVIEMYKMKGVLRAAEVAERYGISKNTVYVIWRGKKWSYLYKRYYGSETIQEIRQSATKPVGYDGKAQRL